MRHILCAAVGISLVALNAGCARQDASAMSQGQAAAILHELQEIRKVLENQPRAAAAPAATARAAPRPQRAVVSIAGAHSLGRDVAPLTLVEFTDYQCPFCGRFATTTFDQIKAAYIDTGQLRLVSRDLPLPIHNNAEIAAYAARCAAEQGKYWEMRHTMFRNTTQLDQASLVRYAGEVGLAVSAFEACLTSGKYVEDVRADAAAAGAIGITGTPSFVLGKASGGQVDGTIIVGAQPFAAFDAQIKALLAEGR